MPGKILISKMKRRRKLQKANKDASDRSNGTETSEIEKRVHFGESSVVSVDPPTASLVGPQDLWYNREELKAQFVEGLELHLREQIQQANAADGSAPEYCSLDKSTGGTSSRGLEFHCTHNHRRKQQAESYVRAIVEYSWHMRKPQKARQSFLRKKKQQQKQQSLASAWAEDIYDYASQLTWMTRDVALGVAAEDEAEARAVYEEHEHDPSDPNGSNVPGYSTPVPAGTTSILHQKRQPYSLTAKSA